MTFRPFEHLTDDQLVVASAIADRELAGNPTGSGTLRERCAIVAQLNSEGAERYAAKCRMQQWLDKAHK